jgi:hypothetical protein
MTRFNRGHTFDDGAFFSEVLVFGTEVLTLGWQWVLTVVNLATPMSNRVAVARCCLYFALETWLISFNILLQDLLKRPSASSKITKQRSHACG